MSETERSYALVLGVGPRLGGAFAKVCDEEGHVLVLVSRSAERMSAVVDGEGVDPNRAYLMEMDLEELDTVRDRFNSLIDRDQVPWVVVYNAAALRKDSVEELRPDELLDTLKVNVAAALQTVRSFVPAMAGRGGSILLVGGGFYMHPNPDYASLSIGKGALRNLAHAAFPWAKELGVQVTQITVNGFVEKGTSLDPHLIARRAIEETKKPTEAWRPEVFLPE